MKPIKRFSLLTACAALIFTLAACQDETTPPENPATGDPASNLSVLNEGEAVTLAAFGEKIYYHVASGGEPGATPTESVTIEGNDFRYLGGDLDTMEKLRTYLAQAFTAESIDSFIREAGIREHEGKTVQPNADKGSILQWENAMASLIDRGDEWADFELKIPYGEGQDVEFEPITVQYQLVEGVWRIKSNPADLY